jgi:hypothetical protein
MFREMCWLPALGTEEKILHLRTNPTQPWRPYTACPEFSVPDYKILNGSKGWATYQKLMQEKWTLIPSDRALQEYTSTDWDLSRRMAS